MMDYFPFRITVEVLGREFGKNTEGALENVFKPCSQVRRGAGMQAQSFPPSTSAAPGPLGCAVMSRECVSWTCCIHLPQLSVLVLLGPSSLALLAEPAPKGHLMLGMGESQKDQDQDLFLGGAQLSAAAAVVKSEYEWATQVKTPQPD